MTLMEKAFSRTKPFANPASQNAAPVDAPASPSSHSGPDALRLAGPIRRTCTCRHQVAALCVPRSELGRSGGHFVVDNLALRHYILNPGFGANTLIGPARSLSAGDPAGLRCFGVPRSGASLRSEFSGSLVIEIGCEDRTWGHRPLASARRMLRASPRHRGPTHAVDRESRSSATGV